MMFRRFLLPILSLGIFFSAYQIVFATPDPPRVVINKSSLECDHTFYWRDECGEVILPPEWEYSTESACPDGYTIRDLQVEWTKYQNDFCCQTRGGNYCTDAAITSSPVITLIAGNRATNTPQTTVVSDSPAQNPELLPVAGGLSILAGLGLGLYQILRGRAPKN